MNKFKFGDKVLNSDGVLGVVTNEIDGECFVAWTCHELDQGWYREDELTLAIDWVKCSERMPELDDVKSTCTEYFVATTSNDGNEVQRAYYIDWSSNERKWVSMNGIPIRAKVTHWMPSYTPAPPQD